MQDLCANISNLLCYVKWGRYRLLNFTICNLCANKKGLFHGRNVLVYVAINCAVSHYQLRNYSKAITSVMSLTFVSNKGLCKAKDSEKWELIRFLSIVKHNPSKCIQILISELNRMYKMSILQSILFLCLIPSSRSNCNFQWIIGIINLIVGYYITHYFTWSQCNTWHIK